MGWKLDASDVGGVDRIIRGRTMRKQYNVRSADQRMRLYLIVTGEMVLLSIIVDGQMPVSMELSPKAWYELADTSARALATMMTAMDK